MMKLGAFWLKKDKNGNSYMSGMIDNDSLPHTEKIPVVLFKNTRKETDKHPDYLLYLSEPKQEKLKEDDIPF